MNIPYDTAKAILDLPEDRVRAACAVAMGWRWFLPPGKERIGLWPPDSPEWIRWNFHPDSRDVTEEVLAEPGRYEPYSDWDRLGSPEPEGGRRGGGTISFLPEYTRSLDAARVLEDEVRRRFLTRDYARALFFACGWLPFGDRGEAIADAGWVAAMATAEQRARAFLIVLAGLAGGGEAAK